MVETMYHLNGMGTSIMARMAATSRSPLPGLPKGGGRATVFVYDEQGFALPLAEIYLVKVERGTLDVREQITGARTDEYGKAAFDLPPTVGGEGLVYVVEKPGYDRETVTAHPNITTRILMKKAKKEFEPERVILREPLPMLAGLGLSGLSDAEFLRELAGELNLDPTGAGEATRLWSEKSVDPMVHFISSHVRMGADARATIRSLLEARDTDGVLELIREQRQSFFLKSQFLVPAGFFVLGLVVYPMIRRRAG